MIGQDILDIAPAAVFLASAGETCLTGGTLDAAGGRILPWAVTRSRRPANLVGT